MKYIFIVVLCATYVSINAQSLSSLSKGNKFNPSIGLNALTTFTNGSRDVEDDGFKIQELELQFSSDVDAYFRAEATIALHQEAHEEDGEDSEEHSHSFEVEPEEVFVETTAIPHFTFKLGKFYSNFGKYNSIHTHALPFINRGIVHESIFGEEGLSETGIGVSFLAPASWFSELSVQAFQATSEELFSDNHHDLGYSLKWKNLWELSDSLTLELGTSGLLFSSHDHEDEDEENKTSLYGADLTFKWRPVAGGTSSAFIWSSEYIFKNRKGEDASKEGGVLSFMRYRLSKRWFTQIKYEHLGISSETNTNVYSGLVAFIPTEFSSIRLQFDDKNDELDNSEKLITLQLNISIGAHPAHIY